MRSLLLSFVLFSWNTTSRAQPAFTNTFGGDLSENGVDVEAVGSQFRVLAEVFAQPGGHHGELWTFSSSGMQSGSLAVGPSTSTFMQGMAAGPSGSLFLCGSTIQPDSSTHEGLLIKLDASDNVVFAHVGSAAGDQQFLDVAPLPDGGAIVCGIDNSGGMNDALIARIDAGGATVWSLNAGGPLNEEAHGVAVSGDDILITGRQVNYNDTSDCFFARADLSGNLVWTTSWGEAGNDAGEAIRDVGGGYFVMAGTTESFDFDETSDRFLPQGYLIKIDLAGDTAWTAHLGDTLIDRRIHALAEGSNGDLLLAGERDLDNAVDALVMRTTGNGDLLWEKVYDVDGWDNLLSIQAISTGFIAAGWSFGPPGRQVLLIRRNHSGN